MASKKDLVEAHAFSRRRLVTAFVSGAPGGREVEPTRPGRALAAGLAVAVLVLAGAAVYGVLDSPSTVDWETEGLVSERETGLDYLVLRTDDPDDGDRTEVRPLANRTSALLVLGGGVEAAEASREEIAGRRRGSPVGIVGAPESPPEAGALVQSGWTACTGGPGGDPAGVRVRVSATVEVTESPDAVLLLRVGSGGLRLVVPGDDGRAVVLAVPDGSPPDQLLDAVAGTSQASAVTVPDAFVDLFPAGARLDRTAYGVERDTLDDPWAPRARSTDRDVAAAAEVGDLLEVDGTTYLTTPTGLRRLTAFERAVWRALPVRGTDPLRTFADLAALPDVPFDEMPPTGWPTSLPGGPAVEGEPLCARLDTGDGEPGVVTATTAPGSAAAADGVPPDEVARTVDPGAGALVRPADGEAPVLVDDRGVASPLGTGDERDRLGYAGVEPVAVPAAWVALFEDGAPLTVEAARCPTGACEPAS